MTEENHSERNLSLHEVMERIEVWRKTRKSPRPMPEELWEAAANLSKEYSIHRISKALRLNHTALKKRVLPDDKKCSVNNEEPPTFVELGFKQASPLSECIVEMEDSSGAKMRMRFRGQTDFDPIELGKAFWRKGA